MGNSVIRLGSLPKSSILFHLITTEFDWNWIGNSTLISQVIVTPNGGHLVTPNGGHLVTPNSGHLVTPKERDDSVKTKANYNVCSGYMTALSLYLYFRFFIL